MKKKIVARQKKIKLMLLMLFFAFFPLLISSFILILIQNNSWVFELNGFLLYFYFSIASVFLIGFALSPSTVIAVLSGFYLSWYGLIPIIVSYPIAAIIGLFFSKIIINIFGISSILKIDEMRTYAQKLSANQFLLVASLRLSPVLPFAMINIFLATLPLNLLKYTFASMLGMLPRTLVFFWAGLNARDVWIFLQKPDFEGLWNLFPFLLILISLIGILIVLKKVVSTNN